ncbi:MAG: HAD family phosphatase [Akkermansiaceae bacterium]|jgi:beta-phosphoglucomutase family hydrolase|nr:HAD family phosphatase [Akkermansiaceae bacterium]
MTQIELKVPKLEYKALIFDLDGTLVDSMPAHFKAWCKALEDQGQPGVFPEDVFYAMGGRPTRDIVKVINGEQGLHLDADQVASSKKRHYLKSLSLIEMIPAVAKIAEENRGRVPMAVASGSSREVVEKTLQTLGVSDWFDEVVSSNEVANGKPAPDVFLEAASRIGVDPKDCVVFEDARSGIIAARAAGMEVVAVPTHLNLD